MGFSRVLSEPDATLTEQRAWLMTERNVKVSVGCLWKLRRLRLTLKKSQCAPLNETAQMSLRREEWRARQPDLHSEHLVFIDETGTKTNMVRLYGRAPRKPGWRTQGPEVRSVASLSDLI